MIQLIDVTKAFKNNVVLDGISMDFRDGELTVLIGPSGCGKTTTLKMINRLIPATGGRILIDGEDIESIDKVKLRRNMGYVIQQGGLFPHMTIRQNIEIIEKLEGKDEYQILKNTERLMEMVDMDAAKFLDRYPSELSGGQQQRIGVIRALANDPDYVLLDEPFSALDPLTRSSLQDELSDLHRKMGKTMIFVTHDMDEAIKIADRICIMKDGRILQYDTPEEILRCPANDFVANFVGANRIWGSPKFIRVEDFMIRHPVTCDASLSAERCITKLTMRHVDTLLVTGKEGQLLGIVNRKSLYANHRPDKPAGEIMLPPKCTAHPEDSILDVLKMIDRTDASNVPVVDALGRVVGLLTNSNLVSTLSRQYLEDMTEEVLGND